MSDQPKPAWLTPERPQPWDPKVEPRAQLALAVVHDLYPARICAEDTPSRERSVKNWRHRTRVIITQDHAYFFVESPEYPGIALLHDAPIVSMSGSKKDQTGIRLEFENEVIRLFPDQGCGCGSRLRTVRPFPSAANTSIR